MPRPADRTTKADATSAGHRTSAAGRRRSIALAGHLQDEETARAGLDDSEPSVRATALGALARLGRLRLDDLNPAFSDQAAEVRARAAELSVTFGPAGVNHLIGSVSDREPRVVESGCFALGELGAAAGLAVGPLSGVSRNHPDPLCREAAVAALGAIGDPAGLAAIIDATSDKPAVRRRAVLALAPFSGPVVDEALARALTDRDWQVRQAAEDLTGRLR
jgi:HEAT repeat protein